jgi:glucose-fructose oxidoreductase
MSVIDSRRNFIKKIAIGAGVLAYSGLEERPAALPVPESEKKFGVALVGLGYYSTQLLAPALQSTQNCYLAGIVTGTPAKERIWSQKYGIPPDNIYNYDNFEKISENEDIDIVYVVLPNSLHAEFTVRAARAGKHVICEKPMALSVKECREMIDVCKENGVELSIGYRVQFDPHTEEVIRFREENVFGKINYVKASAGYYHDTPKSHWKLQKEYGGGALMDMGVYSIQGARYTIGEEPVAVSAQEFSSRSYLFDEVDETVTFQLEFPGGAIANLMTSLTIDANMLYASADRGWFELNPFSAYSGLKLNTIRGPVQFRDVNQQATHMDEFVWCITNHQPMRVPGEEGLLDLRVVEAIRSALRTGRKEDIQPVSEILEK